MHRTKHNKIKSTRKQTANASHSGTWARILRTVLFVMCMGLLAVASYRVVRYFGTPGNGARYLVTINTPAPAHFMNDIDADFIGGGALPEPNNNREISAPGDLIVSFEYKGGTFTPAIRMDLTDADISRAVTITPAISGTWSILNQNNIMFTPSQNWPADKKFRVHVDKTLINDDVYTDGLSHTFTTPRPTATITSLNTYPAATPKTVIAAAIVSFNYPVDTNDFKNRTVMHLDGNLVDFNVKFDRFARTAIITTAPIQITDVPQTLRIKINKVPVMDGDATTDKVTANTIVDAADNIFRITGIDTIVADDVAGNPQQLLILDTTTAAERDTNWPKALSVYLLPRNRDNDDADAAPHKWESDEINVDLLRRSKRLDFTLTEFESPIGQQQYAFVYDVPEKEERQIYVAVSGGIRSAGGFEMKNGASRIMDVPYPARTVKIAGTGALLAMDGTQELGLVARGGADAAHVNLYKIKSTEINHLISQTYDIFGTIEFKSWTFDAYDMATVFKKRIAFSDTSPKTVNYASVNLGEYMDRTHTDKTGIFIIQTGATQDDADYSDRRLILVTNLGMIRKVNLDTSSALFVSNLADGTPAGDTEVYVLGRNGNAVWAGRTDADGHAEIPALPWEEYRREREPVAIVARNGEDVSFIPYNAYDRRVEYSKFDIDGIYATSASPMNAFIFTDRGIYRPGESVVVGAIVKSKDFKKLAGIPVKLEIHDTRGRTVMEKTVALGVDGMFDALFNAPADAAIGEYNIQLYSLNAKNNPEDMLGRATFRIAEFVPDNMKITAKLEHDHDTGWTRPDNIATHVTLRNLFGTPAAGRRISAHITMTPTVFSFAAFPGYHFTDNFISGTGLNGTGAIRTISRDLDDMVTSDDGTVDIVANIADDIYSGATYNMTISIDGYAPGDGRGVHTAVTAHVSDAPYLIGWRANGDLEYVNMGAARHVHIVAVDENGNPTTANDLTMNLIRRENLTSLVKDANGYYKYQTVTRDNIISSGAATIGPRGVDANLNTTTPGTYFMQLVNSAGRIMANIEYFVAGDKNTDMHSDTNAELKIKLNTTKYNPGTDILVSITAPYAGYGLITIERDRVYAYKWFRTETTNSVQTIGVPNDFEGSGYVNVSFVRDIASRDIFTTPYTYAVAPFMADVARRTIDVTLDAPETIRTNKLEIGYKTNADARLMLFAVNTGILQVARYQIPNPLAHFFKKSALQVETYQILSLILPEYKILREFAKTGGGDFDDAGTADAIATNPFARATERAVAFYSGIIETRAGVAGTHTFDIPEYFNGQLRVYAVATNTSAMGSAETSVTVQHPVIVSVNAPTTVAPGDKFTTRVIATNLIENKSDDDNATVRFQANNLAAADTDATATQTAKIANGTDHAFAFPVTVADTPTGDAEIVVTATIGDDTNRTTFPMSVRPVTPFTTRMQTGRLGRETDTITPEKSNMYTGGGTRTLYISAGADAFVRPLTGFLSDDYWVATDQIASAMVPYIATKSNRAIGIDSATATKRVAEMIAKLQTRQNDDGSFGTWSGGNHAAINSTVSSDTAQTTAYATWILTMARAAGYTVPSSLTARALDYLREYAGTPIQNADDAATHAFAIYVITDNKYVTTAYINQFEEWANKNMRGWKSHLTGQYIAAAYMIMNQTDYAEKIVAQYTPSRKYDDLSDNAVADDAIRAYLMTKHFGDAPAVTDAQKQYINGGEYDPETAAAIILAAAGDVSDTDISSHVTVTVNDTVVSSDEHGAFVAAIPMDADKISVQCDTCDKSPLTWTVVTRGYPTSVKSATNGISVTREYFNADGDRVTDAKIGDVLTVRVTARATGTTRNVDGAMISDLLPGGIAVSSDNIDGEYDFAQIREDRVVIYTDLTRDGVTYTYNVRATVAGEFAIAPIYATSIYNPGVYAIGQTGTFTVTDD